MKYSFGILELRVQHMEVICDRTRQFTSVVERPGSVHHTERKKNRLRDNGKCE